MAFFYEKKPRLRFEIVSQSPVYNIREQIPKLVMMFDGENIREKHQTLSLITLRIVNAGRADTTMQSYDPMDPG